MEKKRKKYQFWTPEQKRIVKENYADSSPQEMIKLLNGEFNISHIGQQAKNLGIRKSEKYKETYGAWAKGKHFRNHGGNKDTQFKPGYIPANRKAIGTIRAGADGYLRIKVYESGIQWSLLQREVWKKHYGEYPPKGTIIFFKNGDRHNCTIENLELITRKELIRRNHINNVPQELQEIIRLKSSITRKINEYEQ